MADRTPAAGPDPDAAVLTLLGRILGARVIRVERDPMFWPPEYLTVVIDARNGQRLYVVHDE
jgi:hypothetical protein